MYVKLGQSVKETRTWTTNSLREKYPYSELFWSTFSRIRTDYKEIRSISPYSVRIRENAEQNNSEYEHSLRSDWIAFIAEIISAISFILL